MGKIVKVKQMDFDIDYNSTFAKNCRRNRKNGAKICNSCPFKGLMECVNSNIKGENHE